MARQRPDPGTIDQRVIRFECRPAYGDPQEIVRKVCDAGGQVLVASAMHNYYGAIFPSKVGPVCSYAEPDFVSELVRLAHQNDLLIISWYYLGAHQLLSQQHPEWKVKTLVHPESLHPRHDYEMCMLSSPYRDYVFAATEEILSLGFDGFWFDGAEVQAWWLKPVAPGCYCDCCKQAFRQTFGADIPTRVDWDDRMFCDWVKWRYDRFDEFLAELEQRLHEKHPKAILGMDHYNRPSIFSSDLNSASNWIAGCAIDVVKNRLDGGNENVYGPNRTHTTGYNARLLKSQGPKRFDVWEPSGLVPQSPGKPDNSVHRIVHGLWTMVIGGSPWTAGGETRCGKPDRTMADELLRHLPTMGGKPLRYLAIHHSQNTRDFWGRDLPGAYYREGYGLYQIATEGHYLTDFVLDKHLESIDSLSGYSVLVLPNSACMSNKQAETIKKFVRQGGVLISTAFTSLFDEWGQRRDDFALADLFGAHYRNTVNLKIDPGTTRYVGLNRSSEDCPVRICDEHFAQQVATEIDIDADYARIATREDSGCKVFAQVKDAISRQWEPSVVTQQYGKGLSIYCNLELGRSFLQAPLTETRHLVTQFIDWGQPMLSIKAPRIVEMTAFLRDDTLIVHLVNLPYSSTRPPLPTDATCVIDEVPVLADIVVTLRGIKPNKVTLPLSNQKYDIQWEGDTLSVRIPKLHYHEAVYFEGVSPVLP